MILFLIGAGLTKAVLQNVDLRPLAQGITLWLLMSGFTLMAIIYGVIH